MYSSRKKPKPPGKASNLRNESVFKSFSIPIWTVVSTLILAYPCLAIEAPDIIPNEPNPRLLLKGQQLELTCHGDKPLFWNLPLDLADSDSRLNITHANDTSSPRQYSSTLLLNNVKHTDAGLFICGYKDGDVATSEDEKYEDLVSVYVEDEDNLLVHPKSLLINAPVGTPTIIPCQTSWPEVKIEIFNHSNNDQPIHLDSTNYSILQGLTLHILELSSDLHTYICKATYKNKTQTNNFTVITETEDTPQVPQSWFPPVLKAPTSVAVGSHFTVSCYTEQNAKSYYQLELTGPAANENGTRVRKVNGYKPVPNKKAYFTDLVIQDARVEDSGNYSCTLIPSKSGKMKTKSKVVTVFAEGQTFLKVFAAVENITVRKDETAQWVINISSFPLKYDFIWRDPAGKIINLESPRYAKTNTSREGEFSLQVFVARLDDMGPYPLTISLPGHSDSKTLNLFMTVKAPAEVKIEPKGTMNCKKDSKCSINCTVKANPPADSRWQWETYESSGNSTSVEVKETTRKKINHGFVSVVNFNGTEHGEFTCFANNSRNGTLDTTKVRIVDSDFNGNGPISIIVSPEEVVEGDDVDLTCAVSKLDDKGGNIQWVKITGESSSPLKADTKVSETQWSRRKTVHLKNIQKSATGSYKCSANGEEIVKHLTVLDVALPIIDQIKSNLNNQSVELKPGDTLDLNCSVFGRPKPTLEWTLDDLKVSDWPLELKYEFLDGNRTLSLKYVPLEARGKYSCKATNRNGTALAFVDIDVKVYRPFSKWAIGAIMILLVLVVVFGIILAKYKYKQGEMKRFMKQIKQEEFYNGAVDSINPELSVTDQAYLLPFDNAWEFPKDRLKLGVQLGSGAFGRVVKAEAFGILDTEARTTVAVKMVKPNADDTHFKALMSELKIMVHLGKHINVVNLLGACTKNLAKKKELYVIVEYCKYGSLLSYMHRNKRTFINQLDLARGIIDPTIDRPIDRNSEMSQAQRKPASNGYRTLEEFNGPNPNDPTTSSGVLSVELGAEHFGDYLTPNRGSTEHYVAESNAESTMTGMTYLSNGHTMTDGTTKRRSSCGSQWQDHYRGDYQARDVQPIKTTDLLCWAFQIARGMEYLASRKVLHGDLAARNVLLAENINGKNVVKICDFGLAKEMYKGYKYKKKSEGALLPVKWMAIESIFYGLFSTQSDCWSFGVVLWELFTLGKTPYPGMDADERFYKRISEGYRMEKPLYAPSCVYDIMLECWAQEPTERPSFSALVDRIGDMMQEGLRNHYIDLNAEYMRINQTYLSSRPDYLLQMGRTEFASDSARPTPERQYQNVPEEVEDGYLKPIKPFASVPVSPTSPTTPQYQNIDQNVRGPTVVAVNNGYKFLNYVPEDTSQSEKGQNENVTTKVDIHIDDIANDIKDFYLLREDSTSPDRNSFTEGELDDKHVNIEIGNDGIRGIDNMNYVPNHMLFNKNNKSSSQMEPLKLANGTAENGRRQKRQKNDSGLGSIDSTQFEHHKFNNHDGHQSHYSELGLQDSNGYVTHQNITSLS